MMLLRGHVAESASLFSLLLLHVIRPDNAARYWQRYGVLVLAGDG